MVMQNLNLMSKEDAGYRAARDDEMCKNCDSFKSPDICSKVENPVDATMVCDEFSSLEQEIPKSVPAPELM